MRIRVSMNILKPLKRRMMIKREGGKLSWINFKYERLSSFCFVCGILGHSERDCNVVYENSGVEIERAYGSWLRAPGRNNKNTVGSSWLRNEGDSKWKNEDEISGTVENGSGDAQGDARIKGYGIAGNANHGDNGTITVNARNSEIKNRGGGEF